MANNKGASSSDAGSRGDPHGWDAMPTRNMSLSRGQQGRSTARIIKGNDRTRPESSGLLGVLRSTGPRLRRTAASVLLAMGAVVATSLIAAISPAPALASCVDYHTNMDGYDATAFRFGTGGEIYVNTEGTLDNLQSADYRSFFVFHDNIDFAEVGWGANAYGHSSPTAYIYWDNNGAHPPNNQPEFYKTLTYNTDWHFKVQDTYGDETFYVYLDDENTPFNQTPTMGFYKGDAVTNSEHYNSCDSLWTHMWDLSYFNEYHNWVSSFGDLEKWTCNDYNGNWLFNKISNSELYIDSNDGHPCS